MCVCVCNSGCVGSGNKNPAKNIKNPMLKNPTATRKYVYRSSSLSRHMIRSLDRHMAKIGTPLYARGISHGNYGGWYRVIVAGTNGRLVLKGCSWGYSGEGCRATESVLIRLGCPMAEIEQAAFRTPNTGVGSPVGYRKEFFRILLATSH